MYINKCKTHFLLIFPLAQSSDEKATGSKKFSGKRPNLGLSLKNEKSLRSFLIVLTFWNLTKIIFLWKHPPQKKVIPPSTHQRDCEVTRPENTCHRCFITEVITWLTLRWFGVRVSFFSSCQKAEMYQHAITPFIITICFSFSCIIAKVALALSLLLTYENHPLFDT